MVTIRRIDPYTAGKAMGSVSTIVLLIVFAISFVFFVLTGNPPAIRGPFFNIDPATTAADSLLLNYALAPIITFFMMWFSGFVMAALYNLAVPYIGGIKIQIDAGSDQS